MLIQYGYVILFFSIYPLAPALALSNNLIDVTWSTDALLESVDVAGAISDTKTFTHVGKLRATLKNGTNGKNFLAVASPNDRVFETIAVDVVTLVRDTNADGTWKIREIWRSVDWHAAALLSSS